MVKLFFKRQNDINNIYRVHFSCLKILHAGCTHTLDMDIPSIFYIYILHSCNSCNIWRAFEENKARLKLALFPSSGARNISLCLLHAEVLASLCASAVIPVLFNVTLLHSKVLLLQRWVDWTKLVDLFLLLLLLLLVLGCTLCFLFFNCLFNLFWVTVEEQIYGYWAAIFTNPFIISWCGSTKSVDFTGKQIVQQSIEYLPLLFAGIATSTFSNGESESQKAMTGMLTLEASLTACESVRGSVTIKSLGSLKFCVI